MAGEAMGQKRALKPSACKRLIRKRLAESFEEIVEGFVKEAKKGSCAHVKLTSELLETASREKKAQKKGSAERMLEKWAKREKQETVKRVRG